VNFKCRLRGGLKKNWTVWVLNEIRATLSKPAEVVKCNYSLSAKIFGLRYHKSALQQRTISMPYSGGLILTFKVPPILIEVDWALPTSR
jgi:hypothetical protein